MKRSKQKGITLIALVITIVVLIILAGISISALRTNRNSRWKRKNRLIYNRSSRKRAKRRIKEKLF